MVFPRRRDIRRDGLQGIRLTVREHAWNGMQESAAADGNENVKRLDKVRGVVLQ